MEQEHAGGETAGGITARHGWTWSEARSRDGAGEAQQTTTSALRRFRYFDGRVVEGWTAAGILEALRIAETIPPKSLERFLDLLFSRGSIAFGVEIEVGVRGEAIEARCARALDSLIVHGLLRPVFLPQKARIPA